MEMTKGKKIALSGAIAGIISWSLELLTSNFSCFDSRNYFCFKGIVELFTRFWVDVTGIYTLFFTGLFVLIWWIGYSILNHLYSKESGNLV